ncbi:acyltransferase [Akkermansiaceae bacterium]|nr:acyltransferase [Akkermansiaceae bacterium]MDB4636725.1 acyltransferase [Akkermansiaceae bacterium]
MSIRVFHRDVGIDILRSASLLYLMCWHINDYISDQFFNPWTNGLSIVALSVFFHVSGSFSIKKYDNARIPAFQFFLQRIKQIYPFYFVALVVFLLTGLIECRSFVGGVFIATPLLNIPLRTLWFIPVLLIFTALVPLIVGRKEGWSRWLVSFALWGLILVLAGVGLFEARMALYFPVFFLRALLPSSWLAGLSKSLWTAALLLAGAVCGVMLHMGDGLEKYLGYYALALFSPLPLLRVFRDWRFGARTLELLNQFAFGAYLFHRPVFELIAELTPDGGLVGLWLLLVGVPAAYLLGCAVFEAQCFVERRLSK